MANEQLTNAKLEQVNSAFEILDIEMPAPPGIDWSQWLVGTLLFALLIGVLLLLWWFWRQYRTKGTARFLTSVPCFIRLLYLRSVLADIHKLEDAETLTQLYGWYRLLQVSLVQADGQSLAKQYETAYETLEKALFAKQLTDAKRLLHDADGLIAQISLVQLFKSDMQRFGARFLTGWQGLLELVKSKNDRRTDKGAR